MNRWRDDRGATDVAAMLVIVPLIFGVVTLLVFVGREGRSVTGITHAAQVAARAASLERSAGAAQSSAAQVAASTLAADGTACAGGPSVSVGADRWAPGGVVTVRVTCAVSTGDLGGINPPSRSHTAEGRAVIDTYRGWDE